MWERKWTAMLVAACVFLMIPFSAMGEADTGAQDAGGTIFGVPLEDLPGGAGSALKEAAEEAVSETADELGGIFGAFAEEMSKGLGDIADALGGESDEKWFLKLPGIPFETVIGRSPCDLSMDLYNAQFSGEADRDGRIARSWTEETSCSVVYLWDEGETVPAIREAARKGIFGREDVLFSPEGYWGTYTITKMFVLPPSVELYALLDRADLTEETLSEACCDYAAGLEGEYNGPIYENEPEFGGGLGLALVFWSQDAESGLLVVIAKEVPVLLE